MIPHASSTEAANLHWSRGCTGEGRARQAGLHARTLAASQVIKDVFTERAIFSSQKAFHHAKAMSMAASSACRTWNSAWLCSAAIVSSGTTGAVSACSGTVVSSLMGCLRLPGKRMSETTLSTMDLIRPGGQNGSALWLDGELLDRCTAFDGRSRLLICSFS